MSQRCSLLSAEGVGDVARFRAETDTARRRSRDEICPVCGGAARGVRYHLECAEKDAAPFDPEACQELASAVLRQWIIDARAGVPHALMEMNSRLGLCDLRFWFALAGVDPECAVDMYARCYTAVDPELDGRDRAALACGVKENP